MQQAIQLLSRGGNVGRQKRLLFVMGSDGNGAQAGRIPVSQSA